MIQNSDYDFDDDDDIEDDDYDNDVDDDEDNYDDGDDDEDDEEESIFTDSDSDYFQARDSDSASFGAGMTSLPATNHAGGVTGVNGVSGVCGTTISFPPQRQSRVAAQSTRFNQSKAEDFNDQSKAEDLIGVRKLPMIQTLLSPGPLVNSLGMSAWPLLGEVRSMKCRS